MSLLYDALDANTHHQDLADALEDIDTRSLNTRLLWSDPAKEDLPHEVCKIESLGHFTPDELQTMKQASRLVVHSFYPQEVALGEIHPTEVNYM